MLYKRVLKNSKNCMF